MLQMGRKVASNMAVGKSVNRVDAVKKVTGQATYIADMHMPNTLYAWVKRSPYAHAKIISIDTSKAIQMPGVKNIITGDHYTKRGGLYLQDKNFLAVGKARYLGEAVAAVCAETLEQAQAAVDAIEVVYEELPAVTNAIEGMKEDAPLIHPDLGSYKVVPIFSPKPGTNISHHYKMRKGDVDKAFKEAHYTAEYKYYVPHIQHAPMEPHGAIAQYDADDRLTVWAGTQSPYAVRQALADSFDIPLNKIRVISPNVGGGFGAKAGTTIEGIIIPLAKLNKGRPVRLIYTREDEFENSYVRQALHATIKTAVDKNGKILGVKNEFIWDGGAYTEYGVNIVKAGGNASAGPYNIDNVYTDSYCIYTNHPVGGPLRGFGMCEIHFAIEQNLDKLAHDLGISPIEIRRINGLRVGDKTCTGEVLTTSGYHECLDAVVENMNFDTPIEQPADKTKVRGRGIAAAWKSPSMPNNVASSAIIRMNEDGTFYLLTSGHDIGQGSDTALTQIAAEVLSVDTNLITIKTGDTDHTPYEWQTVASRITYCAGNAVKLAAEDMRDQIFELAQVKLGVSKDRLYLDNGDAVYVNDATRRIPISTFALGLSFEDGSGVHGPLIGKGSFVPPNVLNFDKKTGQGSHPVAFWTMGCQGSEVEIDLLTGQIKVLKCVQAFDAGKVINPKLFEGQVEGGMIQSLGTALFEELKLKNGKILNKSFMDYKIPTADDMPDMTVIPIEMPEKTGPFGARGIGEPVMVPGAPSIANAIYDAIGKRFDHMPITAEMILQAIKEK